MGLVDESTKDIVNEYENNFPDAELLFCTWKSQNVEDISCKTIQIDYPSFLKKKDEYVHPHAFTINISILQAREALKCIDADIILRSRSDLFIHNKEIFNIFLKNCDDSRIMVPYIYEQEKLEEDNVERVLAILDEVGSRENSQRLTETAAAQALDALEPVSLPTWARIEAEELVDFLARREY